MYYYWRMPTGKLLSSIAENPDGQNIVNHPIIKKSGFDVPRKTWGLSIVYGSATEGAITIDV